MPKHFTLEAVEGSTILAKELVEASYDKIREGKKRKIVFSFSSGEREPRNNVEYELTDKTSFGWFGGRRNVFVFKKIEDDKKNIL